MKDETLKAVSEFNQAFEIDQRERPHLGPTKAEAACLLELSEMLDEVAQWAHSMAEKNDKSSLILRIQLMAEELGEVSEAMAKGQLKETLHEMADLRYVCDGSALVLGLGDVLVPAVLEIHRANMSKLDERGRPIKNSAGRVVKSSRFRPADVGFLLKE